MNQNSLEVIKHFSRTRASIRTLARTARTSDVRSNWMRLDFALVVAESMGARIGAIRRLKWSDINFMKSTIRFHLKRGGARGVREIPAPARVVTGARTLRESVGNDATDWIFPAAGGLGPWSLSKIGNLARIAERAAAVRPPKHGRWQAYRREWATERRSYPKNLLVRMLKWIERQLLARGSIT